MLGLRSGKSPQGLGHAHVLVPCIAGLLALGGCSSTRAPSGPTVFSWNYEEPQPVAVRPPVEKRDIEDDGIDAQTAPARRIRMLPDDPSQPWSRNYGAPPPAVSATGVNAGPTPLPPAAGPQHVTASEE